MHEKLGIVFSILGLILTITLFIVGDRIRTNSDSLDVQTFNDALFYSDHKLLVTLHQMGFPLNQEFIQGTYARYVFAISGALPNAIELTKVKSIDDYLLKVGYSSSTTFDFEAASQIRKDLSQENNSLQFSEILLFVGLALSQLVTIYFSQKTKLV